MTALFGGNLWLPGGSGPERLVYRVQHGRLQLAGATALRRRRGAPTFPCRRRKP